MAPSAAYFHIISIHRYSSLNQTPLDPLRFPRAVRKNAAKNLYNFFCSFPLPPAPEINPHRPSSRCRAAPVPSSSALRSCSTGSGFLPPVPALPVRPLFSANNNGHPCKIPFEAESFVPALRSRSSDISLPRKSPVSALSACHTSVFSSSLKYVLYTPPASGRSCIPPQYHTLNATFFCPCFRRSTDGKKCSVIPCADMRGLNTVHFSQKSRSAIPVPHKDTHRPSQMPADLDRTLTVTAIMPVLNTAVPCIIHAVQIPRSLPTSLPATLTLSVYAPFGFLL